MGEYEGTIIARGITQDTDMFKTHLNNNVILFGTPGGGKTRGFVEPNIMQMNSSYVITDPKGNLVKKYGPMLRQAGYKVQCLDLVHPEKSANFNPLDYVVSDEDIQRFVAAIMTTGDDEQRSKMDAFWEMAPQVLLKAVIRFCRALGELTMERVFHWLSRALEPPRHAQNGWRAGHTSLLDEIITAWASGGSVRDEGIVGTRGTSEQRAEVLTAWRNYTCVCQADVTNGGILMGLTSRTDRLQNSGLARVLNGDDDPLDIAGLGRRRTAIFVVVSDTDRSLDFLVSLFYSQLFHELCRIADNECDDNDNRLPVPVRVIMDDFANQAQIPDFETIIAAVRSRDIWLTPVCQATSQLRQRYGLAAETIIGCCDTAIYLGVNDMGTAQELSLRSNIPVDEIQALPIGEALVFTRGRGCRRAAAYQPEEHPNWHLVGAAQREGTAWPQRQR